MTDTITLPRSVVEQALDALQDANTTMEHHQDVELRHSAMDALRAALEQPQVEQEPVAYRHKLLTYHPWEYVSLDDKQRFLEGMGQPLYTHPQPPRQPLTDEQIRATWSQFAPIVGGTLDFARAIERAHGIGGEA